MKSLFTLLLVLSVSIAFSQKKVLDHPDFEVWNTIEGRTITGNGDFVMYSLERGEKDSFLKIKSGSGDLILAHDRASGGRFTYDSEFAIFKIGAWADSLREMKRRKVKKDKMPKDTLGIYSLRSKSLEKIPNLRSHKIPEKWGGYLAYQFEEVKAKKEKKESSGEEEGEEKKEEKKKPAKKTSKDNGYHLVLRKLSEGTNDTIKYVTEYIFAKEGQRLAYITTGMDSTIEAGVYVVNLEDGSTKSVFNAKKAKYYQLSFSESGKNLGFVLDQDTTKALVRPNELYHYAEGSNSAERLATSVPDGYRVSSDGSIGFSKDDSKLYFGLATQPILQDTSLLDDEIVNVEVWTWDEPRLYTVQELQVGRDKRRSYMTAIHLSNKKLVQLATEDWPNSELTDEGNGKYALVSTSKPYQLQRQWQGGAASDYALVNVATGERKESLKAMRGTGVGLSPSGKYVFGYNSIDSLWFTQDVETGKLVELTRDQVFYNELNDSPNYPWPYFIAGWTEGDASIIIYDRYDMWEFNPSTGASNRITKGREELTTYRYLRLDREERFLDPNGKWLLSVFDEKDKSSGYYELNKRNGKGSVLLKGPYRYGFPMKAHDSKELIFTRESFVEFPNLRYSDTSFKNQTQISNANPQQSEYNWGSSELVNWTSLDGKELQGMLIKPENFDPNKKYPMIVNFYEKSSNGLHGHRAPSPGRSTINYSFYTSRGYVIFNPDVHYRIGYPGESAYNCVIPGVTSLIEKGFIDKDRIGVQGHSWGGYQIAYLVTRTDIFRAAEAGAPVPNMISAYGGIRWWTGLSRQFQYEHTQSRIGGTPWDYPARYIENSPIFTLDKVNTPLLIMHNDEDGHVPWYQGIELFVSLRRLGKPSWFLNYNGEPHWPLKLQNRKDFNIRMAQFFDHYLKDEPLPVWMSRGVPAIEKGINQGLELMDNK